MSGSSRLAGRRVLITGGAAGIGRASALRCIAEGASVALLDLHADQLAATAAELGCSGHAVDVTDEERVADAVAAAAGRMGGIDGIVNAAGIMLRGSIGDVDGATWRRVIDVNLTGPYLVIRAAMSHLSAAQGASIVNIASGQALLPNSPDRAAYSASKGGVRLMTKSIALEVGKDNIRCNSVHPGVIWTNMQAGARESGGKEAGQAMTAHFPITRLGEPEDIANCILYLASDESSYVTGAEFTVDGGMTAM